MATYDFILTEIPAADAGSETDISDAFKLGQRNAFLLDSDRPISG